MPESSKDIPSWISLPLCLGGFAMNLFASRIPEYLQDVGACAGIILSAFGGAALLYHYFKWTKFVKVTCMFVFIPIVLFMCWAVFAKPEQIDVATNSAAMAAISNPNRPTLTLDNIDTNIPLYRGQPGDTVVGTHIKAQIDNASSTSALIETMPPSNVRPINIFCDHHVDNFGTPYGDYQTFIWMLSSEMRKR